MTDQTCWYAETLTIVNMKQRYLRPGVAFHYCMQYALNEWKWDDKSHYSLHRKVADLSQTEGLEILTSCPRLSLMILEKIDVKSEGLEVFPIQGGLFKGDYGTHGVEFIRLDMPWVAPMVWPHRSGPKGVKGVKVTGDPNVPFRHTSFKITDNRPLIIPKEAQTSFEALYEYTTGNH